MENGLLITFSRRPIISCSIFVPQLQFLPLKISHCHFNSCQHHHHLRFSFTVTTNKSKCSSKWDLNAKRARSQNVKFSVDQNYDEDEDEDDEEEESLYGNVKKRKRRKWWSKKQPKVKMKSSGNIFDEAIETIWILKVFKSFGWFLPVIIISFLLATGPKAFLMTLSFSLALSAPSLAFEKLFGKTQRRPKRKARIRRKASSTYASSVEMEEEGEKVPEIKKAKVDDQSWVGSNNRPVKRGSEGVPDFGGWDFLHETGSLLRKSRVTSESQRTPKGKLSGSRIENVTPLLLRLLISLFPFIGLWAKMF